MARKIRFPLEMGQGVDVRSLEELREKFSLSHVLMYISNGKLVTWLRDRYEDDIADEIEKLDSSDSDLSKKVCEIFDVQYDESADEDIEKIKEKSERLRLLKEYTSEQKYFDVEEKIAFNQDELYDLLDDGITEIYLCGERFSIPLAKSGISYYGINNPTVVINSKEEVDWEEKGIYLSDVRFDAKYQRIVNGSKMSENMDINYKKDNNKALEIFEKIVEGYKEEDKFAGICLATKSKYTLIGYDDKCLIYAKSWKSFINGPHACYYRYFMDEQYEREIKHGYRYIHCCAYENKLFVLDIANSISDKSFLYVENFDGTARKKLLTRDHESGIPVTCGIEDGVISVYFKESGTDDIWKSEWYDLKKTNEWKQITEDVLGFFSI